MAVKDTQIWSISVTGCGISMVCGLRMRMEVVRQTYGGEFWDMAIKNEW
jgi:hypothetical protein